MLAFLIVAAVRLQNFSTPHCLISVQAMNSVQVWEVRPTGVRKILDEIIPFFRGSEYKPFRLALAPDGKSFTKINIVDVSDSRMEGFVATQYSIEGKKLAQRRFVNEVGVDTYVAYIQKQPTVLTYDVSSDKWTSHQLSRNDKSEISKSDLPLEIQTAGKLRAGGISGGIAADVLSPDMFSITWLIGYKNFGGNVVVSRDLLTGKVSSIFDGKWKHLGTDVEFPGWTKTLITSLNLWPPIVCIADSESYDALESPFLSTNPIGRWWSSGTWYPFFRARCVVSCLDWLKEKSPP